MFLATTALHAFWKTEEPILFLGHWCIPDEKKSVWEKVNGKVLESPELEKSHSWEAYQYTISVYEALLPVIAEWLNHIHHTRYSLRYWRVVIGPFLLWYIQIVYHRYTYLKIAYHLYPNLNTIGLNSTSFMAPLNTHEFYLWASESDGWNLQLITQLISSLEKKIISYLNYDWQEELQQRAAISKNIHYRFITKIKLNLIKIFSRFRNPKMIGLCCFAYEFSKKNIMHLLFSSKFKIFPLTQMETNRRLNRDNQPNVMIRNGLTQLSATDAFHRLILDTLKVNMPLNFIEHYQEEVIQSEKSFPYSPKIIVSTTWLLHDLLKMWGAKKAEQGAKLIDVQHGGGYGVVQYCSYEMLERKNCDAFISWGWKQGEEIFPAPSILIGERQHERQKKKSINKNKSLILWSATESVRYVPYIASYFKDAHHSYYDWQSRFVKMLHPDVLSQVVMRLRPASKKIDYIKKIIPTITVHVPQDRTSFFEHLNEARILLSDSLNTTFLYGLVFNIPTILFSPKLLWEIRDEVKLNFLALQKVGIYHDSPESAGAMLNNVSHDVDRWWNNNDLQEVRKQFCHQFACHRLDWVSEWKKLLLSF